MQMLKKLGRLAFLVPYLVMPFCVMVLYRESFAAGCLFAYLMPLGIESPVIMLYPLCWIISIVCFILCARENKRTQDKKGKALNRLLLAFAVTWTIVHFTLMIGFLSGVDLFPNF